MPDWKLPNGKGTYVVTGAPVVVSDLTRSISRSLIVLLVAALVVMALTLSLVFRARLRLLPLVVAARGRRADLRRAVARRARR